MITDEGQRSAACTIYEAAQTINRAAETIQQSIFMLERLVGSGYGNEISKLAEQLERFNDNAELSKIKVIPPRAIG